MPAAGDQALEHRLASNRRIQVKRLRIELARERNYLFLGDLVGTRLESIASFEIFEVTLAHRELFFCRIAPVSAMCKVRPNFQERAVSSAVEHLVYTERVGGSKPSPPRLIFVVDFFPENTDNFMLKSDSVAMKRLFPMIFASLLATT